jgi:hypothetical protein
MGIYTLIYNSSRFSEISQEYGDHFVASFLDCFVQAFDGLVLQISCIFQQLCDVLHRHVALPLDEVGSILRQSKLCEEVSLNCMLEESVLSLFRIMVHAISQNRKIDVVFLSRLNQEQVILVVSMSVDKGHHALK